MKRYVVLPILVLLSIPCLETNAVGEPLKEFKASASDGTIITLRADTITHEASGEVLARGRVEAKHTNVEIICVGQVKLLLSNKRFWGLEASGNIEARVGGKNMWGNHLFYEEPYHLITLSGNPRVQEGMTRYSADKRILCYTETGVMKFDPRPKITINKKSNRRKPKRKRGKFLGLF